MILINVASIAMLAMVFILGFCMGMGKVLRLYNSSIFGMAINTALAVMFGGVIRNLPQVQLMLSKIEEELASRVEFFRNFRLELIIFYFLFFLMLAVARFVLVRFFSVQDNSKVWSIRNTSRILGACTNVVFFVGLWLVFFAVLHYFEDTKFYQDFTAGLKGTFMEWLFNNNPIKL